MSFGFNPLPIRQPRRRPASRGKHNRRRNSDWLQNDYLHLDSRAEYIPSPRRGSANTGVIARVPMLASYVVDDVRATRQRADSESSAMPFGRAMQQLHKQLTKTINVYLDFHKAFEGDTQNIASYASAVSLSKLWIEKVSGGGNRRRNSTSEEEPPQNFTEAFQKVEHATKLALDSAVNAIFDDISRSRPRTVPRLEKAKSIRKKVADMRDDILLYMRKAPTAEHYCEQLLLELGYLQNVVDPAAEGNKELFKSIADNDGSGAWADE